MQFAVRVGGGDAFFIPDQPDDLCVALFKFAVHIAQHHADCLAACGNACLGQVGTGFKALCPGAFAGGNKPAAKHHDENQTGGGNNNPDRSVVKHRKATVTRLGAETGDDQVGRGPDQGGHAAQDRSEGQRHQDFARWQVLFGCDLKGDGHQKRQRADIVHEGRQDGRQQAEGGHGHDRPGGLR